MLSPESHNQTTLTTKKIKSTILISLSWNYFFGIKTNTGIIKGVAFDILSFRREHFAGIHIGLFYGMAYGLSLNSWDLSYSVLMVGS